MKICLECEGISDTTQDTCVSCGVVLSETTAVHFPLRRGEADAANPLIGGIIDGKYLIQGVLGKGGMGTVFRAIHQVSLVPVALKILNPRFSVRPEYREYFLAEAQKAGRVTHEHAGRILDVGEAEDGTVYIAMEEVNGVTLHECIHGDQALSPAVVAEILAQICEGLLAAHQAGIVHRDLSPRNVMVVERQGRPFVKILDFGIAKGLPHLADLDDLEDPLAAPARFANPPYSAPEHLEGKDVDPRADLYSLGVIAYECLTRTLPVTGSSAQERAEATVRGELRPLQAPGGTPARFVRLVRELLAIDPDGRPGSAAEVLLVLRSILQPRSRLVRDLSVLIFVLAVVVCGIAYSDPVDAPHLTIRSGDLDVAPSADGVREVQHLQSARLRALKFDFAGFAADELRAEVERVSDHSLRIDAPLGGVVVDGALELNARRSEVYAAFLRQLQQECRDGPVTVTFKLAGGAALGVARMRLDDGKPELRMELVGGGKVLNGESRIRITCRDQSPDTDLTLRATVGNERPIIRTLTAADLEHPLPVRSLFEAAQTDAAPLRRVRLELTARDPAGNRSEPFELAFDAVDLRLPELPDAELPAMIVGSVAQLEFQVDHEDSGLTVRCQRSGDDPDAAATATVRGRLVSLDLAPPDAPATVECVFHLRDAAGNERAERRMVRFHRQESDLKLLDAPELADRLRPFGKGLLWSGAATTFRFTCNDFYRPKRVALDNAPADWAVLVEAEFGSGRIRLRQPVPVDGNLELVVTLQSRATTQPAFDGRWPLQVQAERLRLNLPDTSGVRFLHELVDGRDLLVRRGEVYDQSRLWVLQPEDSRLLRGGFAWIRRGAALARIDLPAIDQPGQRYFVGQVPQIGYNELCLMLTDSFGRDVDVILGGGEPAPTIRSGKLSGAVKVAEFQYYDKVAEVQPGDLQLEYQQPTRVIFHSRYVFAPGDRERIVLTFQGEPIPCRDLRITEAGTDLVFELEFPLMAVAARLDPDELRRGGQRFLIPLHLDTPAGPCRFPRVPVVTNRSSLVRETLGRRFAGTPASLAAIEMVPVLGPLGELADRVTEAQRRVGAFLRRRTIAVKAIPDCYLQQQELSRRQYADVLGTFLGLPPERRPPFREICFPGDPAGVNRLTEAGMTPLMYRGDTRRFRADVAADGTAAVTGVNFYQAYAIARMAGQVIAGDPQCFRLPFGVELELAALGGAPPGVLNGVAGQRLADLRNRDIIATAFGPIRGLDFGQREWVMDLPWPVGAAQAEQRLQVASWLSDHSVHLLRATDFVTTRDITPELRAVLSGAAVVRGLSLEESVELVDLAASPSAPEQSGSRRSGLLGSGVPGVVRAVHVERGGAGLLPGQHHRLLPRIGLRLAGGAVFLKKVRSR